MNSFNRYTAIFALASLIALPARSETPSVPITLDWNRTLGVSKTHISIHAVPEPPMRRGYPIHDKIFKALKDFNADYARLSLWFAYPKLAVAELRPPADGKTYWDFSLIDQLMQDFTQATKGRPLLFNPSAVPRWMFTTETPVRYPADADEIDWSYNDDRQMNDTTVKRFAEYQGRIAAWYMKGGFKDELGRWHESGHRYKIDSWEVLNEPDWEIAATPEIYTQFYDAVVEEVRKVAPQMRFVGPAHSSVNEGAEFFSYFLDPKNHRAGIPIDWVSYHFYAQMKSDQSPQSMEHSMFDQADGFLATASYIDAMRRKLSPRTGTAIDEVGSIMPGIMTPKLLAPIPQHYWNLSAAMFAYVFGNMAMLGVDVIHVSELIDYPSQVASTTIVDWETGEPNVRYWVAKMLRDNFAPGHKIVQQLPPASEFHGANPAIQIYAQGFISPEGERKLLLVNKRNRPIDVTVPGLSGGSLQLIDASTKASPARKAISNDTVRVPGLAVAVAIVNPES